MLKLPFTTPSQAKRGQNKRRRQQTPESPDSEGGGPTVDPSEKATGEIPSQAKATAPRAQASNERCLDHQEE